MFKISILFIFFCQKSLLWSAAADDMEFIGITPVQEKHNMTLIVGTDNPTTFRLVKLLSLETNRIIVLDVQDENVALDIPISQAEYQIISAALIQFQSKFP